MMKDAEFETLRTLMATSTLIDALTLLGGARIAFLIYGDTLALGAGAFVFQAASFVLLLGIYFLVAEIFLGGWTVGKLLLGLQAHTIEGAPSVTIRLKRLFLRFSGAGLWGRPSHGLPEHEYRLGLWYSSPLLPIRGAPPPDQGWVIRVIMPNGLRKKIQAHDIRSFRHSGEITIGRDPRWASLRLQDNSVSRRHASIVYQSGRLIIQDAGSTQGTTVNEQRLQSGERAELDQGAFIKIGGAKLHVTRSHQSIST